MNLSIFHYDSGLACIQETDDNGKVTTITAILPREEVEELHRRLVGDAWRGIESAGTEKQNASR